MERGSEQSCQCSEVHQKQPFKMVWASDQHGSSSRHVQQGGGPGAHAGHTGEIKSLGWPGNTSVFTKISWRKRLGRVGNVRLLSGCQIVNDMFVVICQLIQINFKTANLLPFVSVYTQRNSHLLFAFKVQPESQRSDMLNDVAGRFNCT